MTALKKIQEIFQKALKASGTADGNLQVTVEYPRDAAHGDYATNIAMQLSKQLGKNPREVAETIIAALKKVKGASKIIDGTPEIAGPGFINIRVKKNVLMEAIEEAVRQGDKFGHSDALGGQRIMLEFAHPNTHKAFHIGHLRNICLGESLVRLLESQGAHVFRANYQGDIGPHVAKCLWGMMNMPQAEGLGPVQDVASARKFEKEVLTTPQKKVTYLGMAYAFGGKAYEADKDGSKGVQTAVKEINKKIYDKDPSIVPLWEITRKWSLDYFDYTYARLDSHFDHLFFESQMYERGAEIVKKHLKGGKGKDIFEKSDGAIVFKGEPYGLHTRVFLTAEGNATYEGKEMANIETQYALWNFDKIVHIVANEQSGYFKVVFKAIELIEPKLEGKQFHVDYGMVNLSSGKMSSRTGDVITADSLIDEAKARVWEVVFTNNAIGKSEFSEEEAKETIEKIAIAAVKFTMLYSDAKRDIAFDMEQALNLTGDTGPYLLYGYTRVNSILKMFVDSKEYEPDYSTFNDLDWTLVKQLLRFEEEVAKSAEELTTHNTAHYLVELVSIFSRWYENNRVFSDNVERPLRWARINLLKAVRNVLANGLYLLGIETVEKM